MSTVVRPAAGNVEGPDGFRPVDAGPAITAVLGDGLATAYRCKHLFIVLYPLIVSVSRVFYLGRFPGLVSSLFYLK